MDTRARGDMAEAAVLHALTRRGVRVWVPWSRFGACDLLAENGAGEVVRIQVKSGRIRGDCVKANARSTDHGNGRQPYLGLVDVLAIHVLGIDEQFVVPVAEACGFDINLRLAPTRNNQRKGVRYARDYRLSDWAERFTAPAPAVGAWRGRGGAA